MNFSFIFIIQIILFISIANQENNNESNNLEFKGIYRINSLLNNYLLIVENYNVQFYNIKNKNDQMFKILKNENNLFYFETKKNRLKLGVNQNGHITIIFKLNEKHLKDTIEWNIIKIEENQYVIQNNKNKKFMENNNNFFQCINDLPQPIEEHKSEISNSFKFSFFKLCEEVEITPEQKQIVESEPIDVVIKYIDLSDKTLNRTGIKQIQKDEDNEELRYSIRSILQYIPWVRKIFILMPNEKVKFFKAYDEIKEKIVYVKDKDVLGYDSANIYAFTFNLFRLEKFGLSNNFIYMDDDFFIGKDLNKTNFFYYDENEKRVVPSMLNVDYSELNRKLTLANYNKMYNMKDTLASQCFIAWVLSLLSTEKFFLDYYSNITLINPTPSHNAISYNIQDLKEIYELVVNNYQYANETLNSIERHILTLQTQHFVDLYEMNIKRRKVHSIQFNVVPMNLINLKYLNAELFAINTGGDKIYTIEEYKKQKEIMQIRFPNPTPYEIVESNTVIKPVDNLKLNNNENNDGNDKINALNSNDNSNYNPNDEEKNKINELNDDSKFDEIDKNSLIQTNKRQSLIIKIFNLLIIFMILIIILLFYLYCKEKIKNNNRYIKLHDYENRKKLEFTE